MNLVGIKKSNYLIKERIQKEIKIGLMQLDNIEHDDSE